MTPVIETPRLLLRPYRDADAADLYAYSRDPRVGVIAGWQPHRSEEESLRFLRTVFSAPDVFALELRESGRAVGSIGFVGATRRGSTPAARTMRSAMPCPRRTGAGA